MAEERSATHKELFLLHSCAPRLKNKGTWAVSFEDTTAGCVSEDSRHKASINTSIIPHIW